MLAPFGSGAVTTAMPRSSRAPAAERAGDNAGALAIPESR
jgi:hypothetical protein